MDILQQIIKYIHLLGYATLTVSVLSQFRASHRRITSAMQYSAWVQLITGIGLVGIIESQDQEINLTKITAKLVLVVLVTLLQLLWRKQNLSQLKYTILLIVIMFLSLIAVFY